MKYCIFPVALLFLLSAVSSPAQVTGLGDFYNLDSFSSAAPVQAPKGYVSLSGSYAGKHLVLKADIAKGWHLYSVTQPEGGTIRSEFKFDLPEIVLLEIRPTSAPTVKSNVVGFDVDIEEHDESVTWIFTFRDALPADATVRGTLDGQVCQEGEGGTCVPVTVPFEAGYAPDLDLAALLGKPTPERFTFRPGSQSASIDLATDEFKPVEEVQDVSFVMVLLYAFLGGLILNVMPCVLPVIGLKILSFFEQAGKSRARAFYLNLWFSLGLLSVFLFLAFMSLGLSILFTFDLFNIIMVCVVFTMALSLMDVWELSVPGFLGSGSSVRLTQKEGPIGAFFKGIITTLLAIPCGAPFASLAVAWSDTQIRSGNMGLVFLVYGIIGLGMASPYLVIGAFPELLRFLPKPGAWMETFKKTMGFCLLVAVVWILSFVQLQRMLPTVALLFALWFACWMIGRLGYTAKPRTRIAAWLVSSIVIALVLFFSFQLPGIKNSYNLETAMQWRILQAERAVPVGKQVGHWTPYTPEAFEAAIASGRPVVVDFTADWCVNCKVLEATVLKSDSVLQTIDAKNVASLVADCTREGDATKLLRKLGPEQVPVLAVFDPKNPTQPTVLRGFYTQKTLLELLDKL